MRVNRQEPIKFINTCNCIVDYDDLEKAILWHSDKPVARLRKIYMYGEYPAVSIYDEKIHVHRILMMYWMDRRLSSKEFVHHLNGNKLCALKSNLAVMISSGHQSLHNKGKILSESHRDKISQANRRRSKKRAKKRDIPLDELGKLLNKGWSINKIANHYNVDWTTIRSRIRENPELLA